MEVSCLLPCLTVYTMLSHSKEPTEGTGSAYLTLPGLFQAVAVTSHTRVDIPL